MRIFFYVPNFFLQYVITGRERTQCRKYKTHLTLHETYFIESINENLVFANIIADIILETVSKLNPRTAQEKTIFRPTEGDY